MMLIFWTQFLKTLKKKKFCAIIHKVYFKKMMVYIDGGILFGKFLNDPSLLAKTLLGIIVVCLKAGHKFVYKIIIISKLNSNFLFEQINSSIRLIKSSSGDVKVDVMVCKSSSGDVKVVICDGV